MRAHQSLHLPDRDQARTPLASVLLRAGIALFCIVFTTLIVYIDRDQYRDGNGTPVSLIDALYYTTVTLSTTGYGDITPITDSSRLINALIITPLRVIFLITLVGTTIEVLTKRSRDEFRLARWRQQMSHHTIVVGYGVKGQGTVDGLLESGHDAARIVVVDRAQEAIASANIRGCAGIVGDATRQVTLERARVAEADRIVIATDRDDVAVLCTLTCRRLNPTIRIVVSARESQNVPVLRQSGADVVIPTAESAGRMLALSLTAPAAGQLLSDLLEPVEGLEIAQRPITPTDLGMDPAALLKHGEMVLAVLRGGELHRFDQQRVGVLQKDDVLVVVRPARSADSVNRSI